MAALGHTRPIGILVLFFIVGMVLTPPAVTLAADCAPESTSNRKSIEQLFGPISQTPRSATPEDEAESIEAQVAKERSKLENERLEGELQRVTNRLQTSLDNIDLWLLRAHIYQKLGRRDAAISDLTEVMRRQGESAELLIRRSNLWLDEHEFKKADADARRAVKLAPENPDVHFAQGKVFSEQWKIQDAYDSFTRAIKLDPDHKLARFNRAYVIAGGTPNSRGIQQAADDLEKVLKLAPEMLEAHFQYARVLYAQGRFQEAERAANYVLMNKPDSECMYMLRYSIYMGLHKYRKALADINRCISYAPYLKSRKRQRAITYYYIGEHEKSVEDWHAFLEEYPDWNRDRFYLANSLDKLERYEEELEVWQKIHELDLEDTSALEYIAKTKAKLGRFEEAFADIDKAIKKHQWPQYYSLKGKLYNERGEFVKGWRETCLERSCSKDEEEMAEYRAEIVGNVQHGMERLRSGKYLGRINLNRAWHDDWAKLWLTSLNEMLADPGDITLENQVGALSRFVNDVKLVSLPKEETMEAIDRLTKIAQGNGPEKIRKKARIAAKSLGILLKYNDPEIEMSTPGCLHFERTDFEDLTTGKRHSFRFVNRIYFREHFGDRDASWIFYRLIRRTPEFIEAYSVDTGWWIRMTADQVLYSEDRENWTILGEAEIDNEHRSLQRQGLS